MSIVLKSAKQVVSIEVEWLRDERREPFFAKKQNQTFFFRPSDHR